jgi:ribosome modulation factor
VPVLVDITEEDKPLTRYVFDRGEEPGPQGQVRDQWLCPYKSTGIMEYWSFGVLV